MMRRALIAVAMLAVAVPVLADAPNTPLGSRLGSRVVKSANGQQDLIAANRTGHAWASCVYAKRRASVAALLNATDEKERDRANRNLLDGATCSKVIMSDHLEGVVIQLPEDVKRGMLAEVALREIPNISRLEALPGEPAYVRPWFGTTGRPAAIDEMAVCTAAQNPAGIRSLLATKPESPEEKPAVQALSATLGPCLPQGATLSANRQSLRAALAEALYHRAVEPASMASMVGKN